MAKVPEATFSFFLFQVACYLTQDPYPKVREHALKLISMQNVNLLLLSQTLNKRPNLNISIIQSKIDALMHCFSNSFIGLFDPNLSCGIFIHTTEDEFQSVRLAAIDSLYQISMKNDMFAKSSLSTFIDMFNDESTVVRLNAVSKLSKLNSRWNFTISEDLVASLVLVLLDTDALVRHHAYRLIRY
jgi:hypothetical protein